MNLIPEIEASHEEIKALRRTIHAHPELRYEEVGTAKLVAENLERWGLEVHRGMGKTGVVGVLKRGSGKRCVGLRADMDALPIAEINTFGHRSQNEGRMHACGHDGHTAMLLGAAKHLAEHGKFDGTIVFIFQPAEEGGAGAKAMIEDGLFEQFPVDAVFGIHNWPGMPAGYFGVTPGPIMASSNEFRINIKGIGSHAALPHSGRDPVFTAVQIANGLQGIITRSKKPIDTAVLSITQIHAGDTSNVVPDDAWLGGTVRTFTVETLDLIERRMRTIAESTAAAYECDVSIDFHRNYPPTINDAEQIVAMKVDGNIALVRSSSRLCNRPHPALDQIECLDGKRSHRATEPGVIGDNIRRVSSMDLRDRKDCGVDGLLATRDDRLQPIGDLNCCENRVASAVR